MPRLDDAWNAYQSAVKQRADAENALAQAKANASHDVAECERNVALADAGLFRAIKAHASVLL